MSSSEPEPTPPMPPKFVIHETTTDLFTSSPPRSILLHAVNARGVWGYGVAKAFKQNLPEAFKVYASHCKSCGQREGRGLVGTCLLIPPAARQGKGKWVGCLFTSYDYGKRVDAPGKILENTRMALGDLRAQLEALQSSNGDGDEVVVGELWAPKFNSGAFGVEWAETRAVVERAFDGFEGSLTVVSYEASAPKTIVRLE